MNHRPGSTDNFHLENKNILLGAGRVLLGQIDSQSSFEGIQVLAQVPSGIKSLENDWKRVLGLVA